MIQVVPRVRPMRPFSVIDSAMRETQRLRSGRRVFRSVLIAAFMMAVTWRASAQTQAPAPKVFGSDAGLVLNFINPEKATDFELVIGKLREVLKKSTKPERRQQAASWKVFKSPDPAAGGAVLYIMVMDPAVKGADYTVSTLLGEKLPAAEAADLYKKYAEAFSGGQNFVNMTLVAEFAK